MLALRVNHHDHQLKKLKVEASIERLDEVIDFVNAELESNMCPPDIQNQIDVAVDEIFTNIASYAYTSKKGNAEISIAARDEILLIFEDSGIPYNPLEHVPPDLDKPLIERDMGGLGIFLTKQFMDKVDYTRLNDKNILTMYKKIYTAS